MSHLDHQRSTSTYARLTSFLFALLILTSEPVHQANAEDAKPAAGTEARSAEPVGDAGVKPVMDAAPSDNTTPATEAPLIDARLTQVIDGGHRSDKARGRDQYRHPYETLSFFGIKPEMTVVEIWPGGGWYSDILAPYLKDTGKYIGASWAKATKNDRIQKALKKYTERFTGNPDLFGKISITELSKSKYAIGPDGSADMVLTFRNVHNWMKFGFHAKVFEAMFKVLKPGGILGVVEHREDAEAFQDPQALSGYVSEETLIDIAEDAGFEFVEKSEINANPMDTRNHPKGVWTLPPSFRLGAKDREKYEAIGESDRATLMFVKKVR